MSSGESGDLLDGVDDDASDTGVERPAQLADGLVVPVHANAGGGEIRAQRDGQLAARAYVEGQALLGDPPRDRDAEERLAGVVDVGALPRRRPERRGRA